MGRPAAEGRLDGRTHRYRLRVQFEDTDLSGVVYHARYLAFLERARSDLLLALGLDQRAAFEAGEGAYAVTAAELRWRAPARLGDDLEVVTQALRLGPVRARLAQAILHEGQPIVEAEVDVAFLDRLGRPRRKPAAWLAAMRALGLPETDFAPDAAAWKRAFTSPKGGRSHSPGEEASS